MRLSTPIWSIFVNRRHQKGLLPLKSTKYRSLIKYGSFPVSIIGGLFSTSSVTTLDPSIEELTRNLDMLAPRFELQNNEIKVLTTPEEFYSTLRRKILSAKKRVFLSSLYIGKDETELVDYSYRKMLILAQHSLNSVKKESISSCVNID